MEPIERKENEEEEGLFPIFRTMSTAKAIRSINQRVHESRPSVEMSAGFSDDPEKFMEQDTIQQHHLHNAEVYKLLFYEVPFLVHLLTEIAVWWDALIFLTVIISYFMLLYIAVFAFHDDVCSTIIFITDICFIIDVILRLSVEIWRHKTQDPFLVFMGSYTFMHWIVDVVSVVPFYIYMAWASAGSIHRLSVIDYYRLNQIARIYNVYRFLELIKVEARVNEKVIFSIMFGVFYIAFVHAVSCIFFHVTGVSPLDVLLQVNVAIDRNTWIHNFKIIKPGLQMVPFDLYVLSYNFAVATATTVGFGDIYAINEVEMTWCIFIMLFGAIFLNGFFTSELTSLCIDLDGARFDLFHRLEIIQMELEELKTLSLFNNKVDQYYRSLWTYREGVFDSPFVKILPVAFVEDMFFDICKEMFEKSYLFHGLEQAFLRAVSKVVEVVLYNSDMILSLQGDHAYRMYYLLQGECRVMSKYNAGKVACYIRAGSIVGESNLFFSFPHDCQVETETSCQLLIIDKRSLIGATEKFQTELAILRSRILMLRSQLWTTYVKEGGDVVSWVSRKSDAPKTIIEKSRTIRWSSGFNLKIRKDIINDSLTSVISETKGSKTYPKAHLAPYITCVVSEILTSKRPLIQIWNKFISIFILIYCLVAPYCYSFGSRNEVEYLVCSALQEHVNIIWLIFCTDVIIEILAAAPVVGLYYQFWDGLEVRKHNPMFYVDLCAATPWSIIGQVFRSGETVLSSIEIISRSFKFSKMIRIFDYLENKLPLHMFWLRLLQTFFVLIYGIHFIACILFSLACPQRNEKFECQENSWLSSHAIDEKMNEGNVTHSMSVLAFSTPYLYSFFFSAAILSSAGFGDFNPISKSEMLCTGFFQFLGFFMIGHYTAILTSALTCSNRPRVRLQQKLITVTVFIKKFPIPQWLHNKVIEYYTLQNRFKKGVRLPEGTNHLLFDAPKFLRNDVLYLDAHEILDGVPIFSKVDSDTIIRISSAMKRFLMGPNTIFIDKGEVRRKLYIIKRGSVGVYHSGSPYPNNILESSSHIGIRDLLFGEPYEDVYVTLSYCHIYSIEFSQFIDIFGENEELISTLYKNAELSKEEQSGRIQVSRKPSNRDPMLRPIKMKTALDVPAWINLKSVPRPPDDFTGEVFGFPYSDIERQIIRSYEWYDVLRRYKFSRLYNFLLCPRVVHPAGTFSKIWNCAMGLCSALIVLFLIIEMYAYHRSLTFRLVQIALDGVQIIDIALKCHWAYYDKDTGQLISHPVKIFLEYLIRGSFFSDLTSCAPFELICFFTGYTTFFGFGKGYVWYSRLRWNRVVHIHRVSWTFSISHKIFKHRIFVLLLLYVSSSLIACTFVAAYALYIACPWTYKLTGDENTSMLPACEPDNWADTRFSSTRVLIHIWDRWIAGLYYVSQVIFVIGFGDQIYLRADELILLILMCIFGFTFGRCVIADLTSAEVDTDIINLSFWESMRTVLKIMDREKLSPQFIKETKEDLIYLWQMTAGCYPHLVFTDLHPALEQDIYEHLFMNKLTHVPLFQGVPYNAKRVICTKIVKLFIRKGAQIMRQGNLTNEMYIISKGKIFISDEYDNYICTLTPGESFGECSMIKQTQRRFNAYACTDVNLFMYHKQNYKQLLERYPFVKRMFWSKIEHFDDGIFEKKIPERVAAFKNISTAQQVKVFKMIKRRTNFIRQLNEARSPSTTHANVPLSKRILSFLKLFYSYGDRDFDLPFVYLTREKKNVTYLLHCNCGFYKMCEYVAAVLCYITAGLASYEICFSQQFLRYPKANATSIDDAFKVPQLIHTASRYFEIIMCCFAALQLITCFRVREDYYCKQFLGIVYNYLLSVSGFLFDLIALVPFILDEVLGSVVIFNPEVKWTQYVFLLRFARLVSLYDFLTKKREYLELSTFSYKILISVSSFFFMAHSIACVFYRVSECEKKLIGGKITYCPTPNPTTLESTWTYEFSEANGHLESDEGNSPWKWYVRSLYWVITVISTTGYGDISANNPTEMVVAIVLIFCGTFILSIILSQLTSGMNSLSKTEREFNYQVNLLLKHLKNSGLSVNHQQLVARHFDTIWTNSRGVSYHKATNIFPTPIQTEITYQFFKSAVSKVALFSKIDNKGIFWRQVCSRVDHSVHVAGTCIVKEGDPGNSIYIVFKGLISGTTQDSSGNVSLKAIYKPGDIFGKYSALFFDENYKRSYRAETIVETLELKRNDIFHLARKFPLFRRNLMILVDNRIEMVSTPHIFTDFDLKLEEELEKEENELGIPSSRKHNSREEARKRKQSKLMGKAGVDEEEEDVGFTVDTYNFVMHTKPEVLLRAAKSIADREGMDSRAASLYRDKSNLRNSRDEDLFKKKTN